MAVNHEISARITQRVNFVHSSRCPIYLHGRHQFMGRSYRSCRFKARTASNPVAISLQPSCFRNGYLRMA